MEVENKPQNEKRKKSDSMIKGKQTIRIVKRDRNTRRAEEVKKYGSNYGEKLGEKVVKRNRRVKKKNGHTSYSFFKRLDQIM